MCLVDAGACVDPWSRGALSNSAEMQTIHRAPVARICPPVFLHQRRVSDLSWRFAEQRFIVRTNVGGAHRRRQLTVRCNEDQLFKDAYAEPPPYTSYIDPNTGEPAPTYGVRPQIAPMQFWGEDMQRVVKSAQATRPKRSPRKNSAEVSNESAQRGRPRTSRRKKAADDARAVAQLARVTAEESRAASAGQTGDGRLPNPYLEDTDDEEEEEKDQGEGRPMGEIEGGDGRGSDGHREMGDASVGEDEFTSRRRGTKFDSKIEDSQPDQAPEDNQSEPLPEDNKLVLSDRDPTELGEQMKHLVYPDSESPLKNDELWWNWRRPEANHEPWSAWQRRMGDSDTVMAAAMAETGQIKLFGEKPTIAEATLARARKHVYKEKRLEEEEKRKIEIGPLAYYSEWVKAWKIDTSLEAVKKHHEETGEDLNTQLQNMFSHQTREEYRIMMGTDIRIRRDPLVMRMRSDQKKNVYGGDPVYPTINYEQDPNSVVDYRGPNFHEPTPSIVEVIRRAGRLITREELQRMQELEKLEEQEDRYNDDGMSGAVDIGDKEDDDDEDEDEDEGDEASSRPLAAMVKQEPVKSLFDGAKVQSVVTAVLEEDDVIDVDVEDGDDDDE